MKLKLFNAPDTVHTISMKLLNGGCDPEMNKIVVIVQGEDRFAGILTIELPEARTLQQYFESAPETIKVN